MKKPFLQLAAVAVAGIVAAANSTAQANPAVIAIEVLAAAVTLNEAAKKAADARAEAENKAAVDAAWKAAEAQIAAANQARADREKEKQMQIREDKQEAKRRLRDESFLDDDKESRHRDEQDQKERRLRGETLSAQMGYPEWGGDDWCGTPSTNPWGKTPFSQGQYRTPMFNYKEMATFPTNGEFKALFATSGRLDWDQYSAVLVETQFARARF